MISVQYNFYYKTRAFEKFGQGFPLKLSTCWSRVFHEKHKDGGHHYHCTVKKEWCQKWFNVRQRLENYHSLKPVRLSITLSTYTVKTLQNSRFIAKVTRRFIPILIQHFQVKTLQTFGSLKSNYKKHSF